MVQSCDRSRDLYLYAFHLRPCKLAPAAPEDPSLFNLQTGLVSPKAGAEHMLSKADAEDIMVGVLLSGNIPRVIQQFVCEVLLSEVMLGSHVFRALVLETKTSLQTRDSQKIHANSPQES